MRLATQSLCQLVISNSKLHSLAKSTRPFDSQLSLSANSSFQTRNSTHSQSLLVRSTRNSVSLPTRHFELETPLTRKVHSSIRLATQSLFLLNISISKLHSLAKSTRPFDSQLSLSANSTFQTRNSTHSQSLLVHSTRNSVSLPTRNFKLETPLTRKVHSSI
jgi:hypothetical protein